MFFSELHQIKFSKMTCLLNLKIVRNEFWQNLKKTFNKGSSHLYPFLSQQGDGHILFVKACTQGQTSEHLTPNWGPRTPGWVGIPHLKEVYTSCRRNTAFTPLFLGKQHGEKQDTRNKHLLWIAKAARGNICHKQTCEHINSGPRKRGSQSAVGLDADLVWGAQVLKVLKGPKTQ